MTKSHHLEIRVYYEDTDFSGFVYHAGYLRFMERGRTEFLRALGVTQSSLHREANGLVFVVARLRIDYLRPGRMDDVLVVETVMTKAKGPVIQMRQAVRRADETLVAAEVTVAAVRDGRPVRLPSFLRAAFEESVGAP
jgi:acyl-CoA thioester hydrolase